jgi:restriction system protein
MHPYAFEHLVKRLLDAMDYVDVEVTRASGDKGVDVVGRIEVGISAVQEVIQVKRMRGNVQRPVLDGLRGSLHRWKAQRGTIITTGGFSAGTRDAAFEVGAAPITLIDGDKLVELLMQHEIGVRVEKVVKVVRFDAEVFAALEDEVAPNMSDATVDAEDEP